MTTTRKRKSPSPNLSIIPHSAEAEAGLLSSMLNDPSNVLVAAGELLLEDDFYVPAHRTVFARLSELNGDSKKVDLITFTQRLRDLNELESLGGAAWLTSLFTFVPTSTNWRYYLEIVKDKATLRNFVVAGTEAVRRALEDQADVDYVLNKAGTEMGEIRRFNFKSRKTLADHMGEKIERMERGEPDADVLKTRIKLLDQLAPIRRGDLPIISSERKAGKSMFALTLMENICIAERSTGIYFSLEDRTAKVVDRLLAGISRIPMGRHHVKQMSDEEMKKILAAIEKINGANIIIYDDIFDLSPIVARIHSDSRENPNISLIVVDYAQLVRVQSRKDQSREREVASVSRALRLCAMETGIPIVLVSQENESGATRESRAIEQDGTCCFKIISDEEDKNKKIISVPWQRNGESGISWPMTFHGAMARFESLAREK